MLQEGTAPLKTTARLHLPAVVLLAVLPAGAVTYSPTPAVVTQGRSTFTLNISRTIGSGEEGYSDDEMDSFQWFGPLSPYPRGTGIRLPRATLISASLVQIPINASLLQTAGDVTITYIADPDDTRQTRVILFKINPPPRLNGTLPPYGVVGIPYHFISALTVTGGTAPFVAVTGAVPPGLSLSSVGDTGFQLRGTPNRAGTFTFTIRVTDSSGVFDEKTFTVIVVNAVQITTTVLPAGDVGATYSTTLQASGGLPPLNWFRAFGVLPPGLTVDEATGRVSGTPTAAGTYTWEAYVSDSLFATYPNNDQKSVTIVIHPSLRITTSSLVQGFINVGYRLQLQAAGGTPPLQWSLVSGSVPGLSLTVGGVLQGTPSTAGTYSLTVRVTDGILSDQKTFPLVIESFAGPFTSVHGATFTDSISAPEGIVTGFGNNLATGAVGVPDTNLPTVLSNVSVIVRDDTGADNPALLYYVSPTQISYVVPAGTSNGLATVTVKNGAQIIAAGNLQIEKVQPGFFTANSDGRGAPSAIVVKAAQSGTQTFSDTFTCGRTPGSCAPAQIDLGSATDVVFIELFGTAIRGRSDLSAVSAMIGGVNIPVQYAGPHSQFPGLDQVNVGPLPRSLMGAGQVNLLVKVDDKVSRPVVVGFR